MASVLTISRMVLALLLLCPPAFSALFKRIRLPGTEQMDQAYHQKRYHVIHSFVGMMLGFDFMYPGVMLMYYNGLTMLFTAFTMTMLYLQILQEEKHLTAAFGEKYRIYKNQVLRYLGRRNG